MVTRLLALSEVNLRLIEHVTNAARRRPGYRDDLPMREQLSEMPSGTYFVARFDHAIAAQQVLDVIAREPVGMLGSEPTT